MRVQVVEVLAGGGAQTVTWNTNVLRYVGKLKCDDETLDLAKFADLLEAGEDISDSIMDNNSMPGSATSYSWSYNLHQYEDYIVKESDSPFEKQITLYTE